MIIQHLGRENKKKYKYKIYDVIRKKIKDINRVFKINRCLCIITLFIGIN